MSIISKIRRIYLKRLIQKRISRCNIALGESVIFNGDFLYKGKAGKLNIGERTVVNSGEELVPVGFSGKTSFWIIDDGHISIGEDCGITNVAICSQKKVQIGNRVLIGSGCKIYDTDFHSMDYKKRRDITNNPGCKTAAILIEDDVFLGAGVIVLKGTHIGARSVVGAGSVVTGNIPSGQIWAGNPARYIKDI